MKILRISIALLAVLIPASVSAADFRTDKEGQVRVVDETINENLYIGAGSASVDSTVNGDVFIGAGQADIDGTITGDLFIGSGNARVLGDVTGDVRVGAGSVSIEGNVGGELMIGGGSVEIADSATIAGEVYVGAGQLVVAGKTAAIMAQAENIHVTPTAQINGSLTYLSPADAKIDEGASILGEVTRKELPQVSRTKEVPLLAGLIGGGILWFLSSVVMVLLFVYGLPAKSLTLAQSWKNSFLSNLGVGFVFLIVAPVAAIVLLVSVIGVPLGFMTLALYPIVLYLGSLVAAIALGVWVRSLLEKGKEKVDWVSALLGLVLIGLAKTVPVVGGLAVFIVFLAALGALVRFDWALITSLRGKKQI